ncbi:MAG: DUF2293 domain-containing protein [Phycisphaerales bacterium]|nr:MAG: DUF2293 domain-containing protein [Phycisphaerales bacterium]
MRNKVVAEHACRKYSDRVGRSAAGKSLDETVVRLALIAHLRHTETGYDELLFKGWERENARSAAVIEVAEAVDRWATAPERPCSPA